MKQASDAMREALKGDSAASAEMSDALQQAGTPNGGQQSDVEMVFQLQCYFTWSFHVPCSVSTLFCVLTSAMAQVPPPVSAEHRQQLEDMGFSANK